MLELAMLTHQPGDKNSAARMTRRVREISNSLNDMLRSTGMEVKNPEEEIPDGMSIVID